MFGFKIIYGKLGESLLRVLESAQSRIENAADVALDLDKARDELSRLRAAKVEEEAKFKSRELAAGEKYDRRERDVEHMLGLERKRQEFELAAAKREAILGVREENLKADRARFEEQMSFHERRFTEEVTYLKDMIGTLAERLPTAHTERIETRSDG